MSSCEILAKRDCVPCRGDVPPLKGKALAELYEQLGHGWTLINEHHLEKTFQFPDWARAFAFVSRVSDIAEAQNHHPNVFLTWGKVKIEIWTHKIDGLTESDFVFAAKCEGAYGNGA